VITSFKSLQVPQTTSIFGKGGMLPAVLAVNHPHAFNTDELDIMLFTMKFAAQNCSHLAKFGNISRFHNHSWHREPFVLRGTSAKRSSNSNAVPMIRHVARLEGLILHLESTGPESTRVMSWVF
jgi:hypothetical protein